MIKIKTCYHCGSNAQMVDPYDGGTFRCSNDLCPVYREWIDCDSWNAKPEGPVPVDAAAGGDA